MKSSITLIGMPGAGKSTTGIILAKILSYEFIDTDILLQSLHRNSLQNILDEKGHMYLRKIEEEAILNIRVTNHVIATGGSAVYSFEAMEHLNEISVIVFLKADYSNIEKRINNFDTRGIAKAPHQTFRELFLERQSLYDRFAEVIVDCNSISQEEAANLIVKKVAPLIF
jgi:shikimate kinase